MGSVDCLQLPWCRCWFYSHDHLEPHFHAKASGAWEVRVFFLEEPPRLEVKFALGRLPALRRRALRELASTHGEALPREWSTKGSIE